MSKHATALAATFLLVALLGVGLATAKPWPHYLDWLPVELPTVGGPTQPVETTREQSVAAGSQVSLSVSFTVAAPSPGPRGHQIHLPLITR